MNPIRSALLLFLLAGGGALALEPIPEIPRRLPPAGGIEVPTALREELEARAAVLSDRVWEVGYRSHAADAGMLVKAVDYALRHGEFYREQDLALASRMLDLAEERHRVLDLGEEPPWLEERGRVVRGYRSRIDGSYQPFGLEIPEDLDLSRPVPLLVWLHGRGDKVTDMHFLDRCLERSQAFGGFVEGQQEAIILHPFGRHCVGWKHAGEIDVFEALEQTMQDYPVDPDRVALAGFSMGGAGAWHIGAHYRDRFCAVHAGAGFAETREYLGLSPEDFPPPWEQTLWKVYDTPEYVRNFLNGPVLAYSGSEDRQRQAADLMERELAAVGHRLRHVIGEGMGHKYDEESVEETWAWLREAWERGRPRKPGRIVWQTPTLRYGAHSWLRLTGLERHWETAVVEADWNEEAREFSLEVENIAALELGGETGFDLAGATVRIEGAELRAEDPGFPVSSLALIRREGSWTWGEPAPGAKRPGLQGPIDDAFLDRFIVVPPDRDPASPLAARWTAFEFERFRSRWRALMRGELPVKASSALDADDIAGANLILWGDPSSNDLIAEIADRLPVQWSGEGFTLRGEAYRGENHVPVLIFPNPLNPARYVVLNSGLTFRESHDRTNSLQNPKLPDWAVIGLDRLPDGEAPGRISAAGFFDEHWR